MNIKLLATAAFFIGILAVHAMASTTQTQSTLGRMPPIKAQTLNKSEVTLPADLPGQRTIVLMAFERDQQHNVDTWINGLSLPISSYAWIETPVVGEANKLAQAFIDGGMRSEIRDLAIRERTITLYTDRLALLKAMGLKPSIKNIFVLVMARDGQLLATVEGDYSTEKAATILAALDP